MDDACDDEITIASVYITSCIKHTLWKRWRFEILLELTVSPRKAEKTASPTVRNVRKAKIPACRSLTYSREAEMSAWKFRKKTVTNNVVSESSGSGDPKL